MRVGGGRRPEDQPEDLRDVVLVHAQVAGASGRRGRAAPRPRRPTARIRARGRPDRRRSAVAARRRAARDTSSRSVPACDRPCRRCPSALLPARGRRMMGVILPHGADCGRMRRSARPACRRRQPAILRRNRHPGTARRRAGTISLGYDHSDDVRGLSPLDATPAAGGHRGPVPGHRRRGHRPGHGLHARRVPSRPPADHDPCAAVRAGAAEAAPGDRRGPAESAPVQARDQALPPPGGRRAAAAELRSAVRRLRALEPRAPGVDLRRDPAGRAPPGRRDGAGWPTERRRTCWTPFPRASRLRSRRLRRRRGCCCTMRG